MTENLSNGIVGSGGGGNNSGSSSNSSGIVGKLCNDPSGLCLGYEGSGMGDVSKSGVYTSLVRLASQIEHSNNATINEDGSSNNTNKNTGSSTSSHPLITIETDRAAILVKEYSGHTVALRVPVSSSLSSETTTSSSPKNSNDTDEQLQQQSTSVAIPDGTNNNSEEQIMSNNNQVLT